MGVYDGQSWASSSAIRLCNSRGYCCCKIQLLFIIFQMLIYEHGAWIIFFFAPNILVIGTVDVLLHHPLWFTSLSSSQSFMNFPSDFVDNPLIFLSQHECFLIFCCHKKCSEDAFSDTACFSFSATLLICPRLRHSLPWAALQRVVLLGMRNNDGLGTELQLFHLFC